MEDKIKKQIRNKVDNKTSKSSVLEGFSPISSTRIDWKSRKRSFSGMGRNSNKVINQEEEEEEIENTTPTQTQTQIPPEELSERRKALFEPLTKVEERVGGSESLLPPPDFDTASYPRGWLIGKKRKLVNIDVVESMRRIAIQEMNRKDREIGELNDILDEDSKVLQIVQTQLLEERGKTGRLERENQMLQEQVKMLMGLLEEEEEEQSMDDHDQVQQQQQS